MEELSRNDCIKILKDFIVTDRKIRNNKAESDYEVFCEIRCKAIETILNDNHKLDRENQMLFEDIIENYVSKRIIEEKIKEYDELKEIDFRAYEEQVKPLEELLGE